MSKNLNEHTAEEIDLSSFDIKKELNPLVWLNAGGEYKLKTDIRVRLLQIAETFYADLELEPELKDVVFTGSLANYNWSSFSDVDLHLILDFMEVDNNTILVKHYVDSKKNLWNNAHDVKIYDFPVEIYVQDVAEVNAATGVYSLYNDKWLIKPDPVNPTLDRNIIKEKAARAEDIVDELYQEYQGAQDTQQLEAVAKNLDKLSDRIKNMRKAGLEKNGEFSYENIVFKVLRRFNYMEKIQKLKQLVFDKIHSIRDDF